jgi:chromosome segregation ATPase
MTEQLRGAYERAGAAAARRQARAEAVAKIEAKMRKWQEDIERQLVEYRKQLERQSSSNDGDFEAGRQRLAAKMQERGAYSKSLADAATFLTEHFRGRTECAALFQELEDLDKSSIVAEPPPEGVPSPNMYLEKNPE